MLLAFDIGNTLVSVAVIDSDHRTKSLPAGKIVEMRNISSGLTLKDFAMKLRVSLTGILKKYDCSQVILCSVVPDILKLTNDLLVGEFSLKPLIAGKDIMVPIKNFYRNPRQVGADRLVCSYAAKMIYKEPLIVIDFGTAITFDVVSPQGVYLGGIIVPGIRLTAESLSKKTALLPKVDIKTPRELIGRDTSSSILSGIFYGYGVMADGLIDLISKKIKCVPKVVLTGGYSLLMKKFISRKICCVDRDLVFKGMVYLMDSAR